MQQNNPNKILEIILKIGDSYLIIPFVILTLRITLKIALDYIDDEYNLLNTNISLSNLLVSFIFIVMIILSFNIIIGIIMRKNNKRYQPQGKYKAKKITYLLLAYFLGIYGVHKFVSGDKLGGSIRLILTLGASIIIAPIATIFFRIPSTYITTLCIIISYGLAISDFVIGLAKISDENKEIYF